MFVQYALLALVALFTLALIVTAVHHFWLGVPYVPSSKRITRAMVEMAGPRPGETVIDLGAGDGRLLIEAHRTCPSIQAIGYEIVPLVWVLGRLRIALSRCPVRLFRKDMREAPLEQADVVFLYMAPTLMAELAVLFRQKLRPGTRIVSHTFRLPGAEPLRETRIGAATVRLYHWGDTSWQ